MENEVKKKEGRVADLEMIASGPKKGNVAVGLVGGKQVSNCERRRTQQKRRNGSGSNGFAVRTMRNYYGCNMDCHGGIH